mgnify:FL=1
MSAPRGRRLVAFLSVLLVAGSADAQRPAPSAEDETVGSGVLERQREAYESFQRRQQQRKQAFQADRKADYEAFTRRMRAQYQAYVGIIEEVESTERDRLAERWGDAELSSQKVWVEYSEDLSERSRVDFEAGTLTIESFDPALVGGDPDALRDRVRSIVLRNRSEAFAADRIASEVERRSRREIEELETAEVGTEPVLWPYLTGESEITPGEVDVVVDFLVARAQMDETRVRGERLQQVEIPLDTKTLLAQLEKLQSGGYAATMPGMDAVPDGVPLPKGLRPESRGADESSPSPTPTPTPAPEAAPESPEARRTPPPEPKPALPPDPRPSPRSAPRPPAEPPVLATPERSRRRSGSSLPTRAQPYLDPVERHGGARRLERSLVFSIIETESAFNPLARSPVPAFGLMQIVPRSAGQDASAVKFGKPRILAPSYLYHAENNIEMGTIYLDILFNRYLKGIRNERSRLYCVIAAYNTGAGNVFRAFTGKTRSKAAYQRINSMTPDQVYRHLIWNLPYKETRQYLAKVVDRMDRYRR